MILPGTAYRRRTLNLATDCNTGTIWHDVGMPVTQRQALRRLGPLRKSSSPCAYEQSTRASGQPCG